LSAFFVLSSLKYERNANLFITENSEIAFRSLATSIFSFNQTEEAIMNKLLESRRFEDANNFAERLREKNPLSGNSYFVTAAYYESISNFNEANRNIQKAIVIDKFNVIYLNAAVLISLKLNDIENAKMYFNRSKAISSDQEVIKLLDDLIKKTSD
jgi:tetratricopeptide (TPR) repeat protein